MQKSKPSLLGGKHFLVLLLTLLVRSEPWSYFSLQLYLGLHIYHDDGARMLLRNFGSDLQTTRRHVLENSIIHTHRCESLTVIIATRLRTGQRRSRGSISGKGKEFFSFPYGPDGLWGPPSRVVKLTAHFHLLPRSRIVELDLHSPTSLHGVVLN